MGRWPALVVAMLSVPALVAGAGEQEAAMPPPQSSASGAWYAFALPFYLPETRFGLGATAGVHRVLCRGCQPSSVHLEAAYTLNQQFSVTLAPRVFTSDVLTIGSALHFALFPDRFYGIGPNSPSVGERFTPRTLEVVVTPERYVLAGRLRAGPKLHLRREDIVAREPGGLLATGAVPGSDGTRAVGLGGSATWDSRDSQFYPHRGSYLEAWYLYYPAALARDGAFGRGGTEVVQFAQLAGEHVLVLEASLAYTHGNVPFTLLPGPGGARGLRGYADGRYRDACAYGVQAEYRFPIGWRVGGVAFAGAGDVAPSPRAFGSRTMRAAGGAGLRVRLTEDGVNLRVDLASSGGAPDVYMLVLEAF